MAQVTFKPSIKQDLAWGYLEDQVTEELVYGGAAGGGKSYLGCYWKVYRRLRYPNSRGITGRATLTSIRDSTLVTFFLVLRQCGLVEKRDFKFNAQNFTISFKNGSREVFKDLSYQPSDPEYERLGSSEYTDAWIEEDFSNVPEKAAEILKSRVRWKLDEFGLIPKILLTCNPGFHWLRDKYISDADGNQVELQPYQQLVQAKVTDNPNKAFVRLYQASLEKLNPYDRARLLDGDWDAVEKTGAEFYSDFSSKDHVSDLAHRYNPEHPLHLTLDFNLAPHMTLNVWQFWGKQACQMDEICLEAPLNSTLATMKKFVERYRAHRSEIFVYGDPAGKHSDTRSEYGSNDYTIVNKVLRDAGFAVSNRVEAKAPSVSMRGLFVNAILATQYADICISIHKTCKKTIADYSYLKKAADGTKEKKKVRDAKTKVSYEKYGHASDANDYLLCRYFQADWQKFSSRGSGQILVIPRLVSKNAI